MNTIQLTFDEYSLNEFLNEFNSFFIFMFILNLEN